MKTMGRKPLLLLLALLGLALALPGCGSSPEPQESETSRETIAPTVSLSETTVTDPETTPLPDPPDPTPALQALATAGALESGHTLKLQGGLWYDTTASARISGADQIVIEATGTGRPTLTRAQEDEPILTIEDSRQIVFRGIRFGYPGQAFAHTVTPGEISLIEILNSESIRFEDCEFFGSTGAAMFLSASENLVFENCQFYDLAGLPLLTDLKNLPSQASFSDCSFETRDSGLMPLHVRDTVFADSSFVGQDGYRIPVLATACEASTAHAANLHEQLSGILAARIPYHRDAFQALTLRQTVFCSADVYSIFDRLEDLIETKLPRQFSRVALVGEKEGEQEPGRRLDPSLGVQLELRCDLNSEEVFEESRLRSELKPLAQLPRALQDTFDDLITGALHLKLLDAENEPLLSAQLRLGEVESLLSGDFSLTDLLAHGDFWLLREHAVPDTFADARFGPISARDAGRILQEAWQTETGGFALSRDAVDKPPVFIEPHLRYTGTRLSDGEAWHQYQLDLTRSVSYDQPDCLFILPIADLEVSAVDGRKYDRINPLLRGQRFEVPDDSLREALLQALEVPLDMVVDAARVSQRELFGLTAGDPLSLRLLAQSDSRAWKTSPSLVYSRSESQIELRTVLYDDLDSPWLVELTLQYEDGRWQVTASQLIA